MSQTALKQVARGEAAKSENPIAKFNGFLDKLKPQMELALPKHLSVDRMCRLALTAFSSSPALQRCEPKSIAASIMTASQLGLEPGVLGQGWLVPYKGKCQFIPGWQGLIDLLARGGRAVAWTGAVFEGDRFEYQLGDDPFCRHVPMGEDDPSKITHVYAIGRVKGAERAVIEAWPIRRIWKHRDRYNKVGADHYSYRNQEMYARKIPLLQVLKYMPKSIELSTAIEAEYKADDMVIDGDFQPIDLGDDGDHSQRQTDVPGVDPLTGEIVTSGIPAGSAPTITYAELMDRFAAAPDVDTLDGHASLIETFPLQQGKELSEAFKARRAALEG